MLPYFVIQGRRISLRSQHFTNHPPPSTIPTPYPFRQPHIRLPDSRLRVHSAGFSVALNILSVVRFATPCRPPNNRPVLHNPPGSISPLTPGMTTMGVVLHVQTLAQHRLHLLELQVALYQPPKSEQFQPKPRKRPAEVDSDDEQRWRKRLTLRHRSPCLAARNALLPLRDPRRAVMVIVMLSRILQFRWSKLSPRTRFHQTCGSLRAVHLALLTSPSNP